MATVTAALVKELRERTAAGMMECKKALLSEKIRPTHCLLASASSSDRQYFRSRFSRFWSLSMAWFTWTFE